MSNPENEVDIFDALEQIRKEMGAEIATMPKEKAIEHLAKQMETIEKSYPTIIEEPTTNPEIEDTENVEE